MNFAVLGSTRGSSFVPVLEGWKTGAFSSQLKVVLSNKKDSGILEKAENGGVEALWLPVKGRDRESYDRHVSEALISRNVDFILLIGFMRILSPYMVKAWQGRIINVHPSLLPKYAGMMDLEIHHAVLEAGDQESGCSVHIVNEEVDGGPILIQRKCSVDAAESAESLKAKVQTMEGEAFLEILKDPRQFLSF